MSLSEIWTAFAISLVVFPSLASLITSILFFLSAYEQLITELHIEIQLKTSDVF